MRQKLTPFLFDNIVKDLLEDSREKDAAKDENSEESMQAKINDIVNDYAFYSLAYKLRHSSPKTAIQDFFRFFERNQNFAFERIEYLQANNFNRKSC